RSLQVTAPPPTAEPLAGPRGPARVGPPAGTFIAGAAQHPAQFRIGLTATRAQLGSALRRSAHGSRRTRAGGRAGARSSLAAHPDSVPRRDHEAWAEWSGHGAAGTPAWPYLQRGLWAQLRRERRDRAGARWGPAGGSRALAVLDSGHHGVGARHRAADRGGEG